MCERTHDFFRHAFATLLRSMFALTKLLHTNPVVTLSPDAGDQERFVKRLNSDKNVAERLAVRITLLLSEEEYKDDWHKRFEDVLKEVDQEYKGVLWTLANNHYLSRIERERTEIVPTSKKRTVYKGDIEKQPGDGNCLFHSVSRQINIARKSSYDADSLRDQTVIYMREHVTDLMLTSILPGEVGKSPERYFQEMKNPGVWGGEPEIRAMSDMLETTIHVYQPMNKERTILDLRSIYGDSKKDKIHIVHVGGVHYDALDNVKEVNP